MLPIAAFFSLMFALAALLGLWVRRKWGATERERLTEDAAIGESVRVDLAVIREQPFLQAAVSEVKWAKLKKRTGGRTVVGGVVVFGPQNLTWAPDDRARAIGARPWKLAWTDLAGSAVRTKTATSSAVLVLTLKGGGTIELLGVDEVRALAAVRRISVDD